MVGLLVFLLIVWAVLAIIGLVIHGLIWLFWIGVILFVVTAVIRFFQKGDKTGSDNSGSEQ